jgi:hypothetical protein
MNNFRSLSRSSASTRRPDHGFSGMPSRAWSDVQGVELTPTSSALAQCARSPNVSPGKSPDWTGSCAFRSNERNFSGGETWTSTVVHELLLLEESRHWCLRKRSAERTHRSSTSTFSWRDTSCIFGVRPCSCGLLRQGDLPGSYVLEPIQGSSPCSRQQFELCRIGDSAFAALAVVKRAAAIFSVVCGTIDVEGSDRWDRDYRQRSCFARLASSD